MIHYTCDLCGRSIRDERYTAKIEVEAAFDPEELTDADLDSDHLDEIAESIAEMESTGEFELESTGPRVLNFDLCPHCCSRFLENPLGQSRQTRLNYSKN